MANDSAYEHGIDPRDNEGPVKRQASASRRAGGWIGSQTAKVIGLITAAVVVLAGSAAVAVKQFGFSFGSSQSDSQDPPRTPTDRSELDILPGTTIDTDFLNPNGGAVAQDVADAALDPRLGYAGTQYGDPMKFGVPGGAQGAVTVIYQGGQLTARGITVEPAQPDAELSLQSTSLGLYAFEDHINANNRTQHLWVQDDGYAVSKPFAPPTEMHLPDGKLYKVTMYEVGPVVALPEQRVEARLSWDKDPTVVSPYPRSRTLETDETVTATPDGVVIDGQSTLEL